MARHDHELNQKKCNFFSRANGKPFPFFKRDVFSKLVFSMQAKGMKDFEINDELRVECVSFSSKGIPVMSLVDDE